MMAGKPSSLPPLSPSCSLRTSLLSLATLTLISFTYISFKSLHYSSDLSSITPKVATELDLSDFSDIYHSPEFFRLNYAEMEKNFKVFIYPDGDPNTFYQTPRKLTGKYASEGYFFQNIRESRFRTTDPDLAHLFFIPISCHKMRGKGTSYENMTVIVDNYVQSLIMKYPYWNRTLGADHFFVTCHDVGVRATEGVPLLVKNSIRVVCSPSYDVGFIPHKDVALPQVLQPFALPAGGNGVENRTTLGFWAGHRNSKIRVILARVWENDTELDISNNRINRATGPLVYQKRFYRTKFCICPGGSQVNSARIADSIHYGCIPVILSNFYDLPFNDILNWRKFSVILKENDVYRLKYILKEIPDKEFLTLHNNLVKFCQRTLAITERLIYRERKVAKATDTLEKGKEGLEMAAQKSRQLESSLRVAQAITLKVEAEVEALKVALAQSSANQTTLKDELEKTQALLKEVNFKIEGLELQAQKLEKSAYDQGKFEAEADMQGQLPEMLTGYYVRGWNELIAKAKLPAEKYPMPELIFCDGDSKPEGEERVGDKDNSDLNLDDTGVTANDGDNQENAYVQENAVLQKNVVVVQENAPPS